MKYNKMKVIVGVFVITLVLSLVGFLIFFLKEKGVFDKRYTYNFTTSSAEYFHVGMPLRFSGFNIGVIDDISLKDDGSVYMEFSVSQENKKWVSIGSVLMIIKPLIGTAYIELYTSLGSPPLAPGDPLVIMQSDTINDLINNLQPAVKKATNILDSIDKITTYLASEDSELKHTLQNIEKLTAKLANDKSLLTSVTGDAKSTKSVVASLNESAKIMKDIKKITADMSTISASLGKDIVAPASSSMREVESIMRDIKAKLDALDSTVNAVGSYDKELIEIKDQISVGMQKSNQLLDKVDSLLTTQSDKEVLLP
jgi:ABC-type transporter Mla subunit MlaD